MRYWEQDSITILKLDYHNFCKQFVLKSGRSRKDLHNLRRKIVSRCSHYTCRNKIVFNIFQYIVSYWLGWWENEIDIFDSSQYSELVLTKSNLGKLADILAGADILLDFIYMTRQKRKIQIIINSVFKNFKSWFKFFVLRGRWWFPLTAEITQRH